MEVVDFSKLMKDSFNVLAERSQSNPKHMRFMGPPYDPDDPACKYITVQTRGYSYNIIKASSIESVLRKFDKTEDDFKEAFNATFGQVRSEGREAKIRRPVGPPPESKTPAGEENKGS